MTLFFVHFVERDFLMVNRIKSLKEENWIIETHTKQSDYITGKLFTKGDSHLQSGRFGLQRGFSCCNS